MNILRANISFKALLTLTVFLTDFEIMPTPECGRDVQATQLNYSVRILFENRLVAVPDSAKPTDVDRLYKPRLAQFVP